MNLGGPEILILGAFCVVGLIIPVGVLAFLYVINNKLTRIEQLLDRKE